MSRILIIDDEPIFLVVLNRLLTGRGYDVTQAGNGEEALQILQSERFDLMISDINMSPVNGLDLLSRARESYAKMGVIMLTACDTVEPAVKAMKDGAFDYVTKPFRLDVLLPTVRYALEYYSSVTENKKLLDRSEYRALAGKIEGLVAESPGMCKICDTIERIAPSDTTVLIYGEHGSGKKLVARDIHRYSPRKDGPFLAINCTALPATRLTEAAPSGAPNKNRAGASVAQKSILDAVRGGTLFLNEIDAMPLDMQAELLCVLQEKNFSGAGNKIDVRIIAASCKKLEPLIEQGKFREDLYVRLSAIRIDIPPLRSRTEDLRPLVGQILRQILDSSADWPVLDHEIEEILDNYNWPGNVRELEEVLRHVFSVVQNKAITKEALPAKIVAAAENRIRAEGSARRCEQFKGRSLRAFLHDKEKELLARTRESLRRNEASSATDSRQALFCPATSFDWGTEPCGRSIPNPG